MKPSKALITVALAIITSINLCAQNQSVVVIRAEYQSTKFTTSREYTQNILNLCSEYFQEQLQGHYSLNFTLAPQDVTLPDSYIGTAASTQIIEACRLADQAVDFSQFDLNKDGTADAVCVIFAGEEIWPEQHSLSNDRKVAAFDATAIENFVANPELFKDSTNTFNIYCHEFAHLLGLKDMYDSDGPGSSGQSEALWGLLSPMDTLGLSTLPNFSAVEFDQLGIGTKTELCLGGHKLSPIDKKQEYLYAPSDTPGEYYLLECRAPIGRDSTLSGSGLVIYHIDKSANRSGYSSYYNFTLTALERWERDQVNCRPDHQCADVVEAKSDARRIEEIFFPQTTAKNFGSDTEPAWRYWNGNPSKLAIVDIQKAGNCVEFSVIEPIKCAEATVFQSEAVLTFETDPYLSGMTERIEVSLPDTTIRIAPKVDGKTSCTISGLKPGTTYRYTARVITTDGSKYSVGGGFRTKIYDERNSRPFIYLIGTERNPDGSFSTGTKIPLHVYNLINGEQVNWYFDGIRIADSLTTSKTGELRAEILYSDGTTETIVKQICVR